MNDFKIVNSHDVLDRSGDESGEDAVDDSQDLPSFETGDMIMGVSRPDSSLRTTHPAPVFIFRLWQTFLDRANPLTKLLYAPTVQQHILEATTNLEGISRGLEALMFAIYSLAISTMDASECQSMMGEPRGQVLGRFLDATKKALVNASFLRSTDMTVLQALVLYLVCRY